MQNFLVLLSFFAIASLHAQSSPCDTLILHNGSQEIITILSSSETEIRFEKCGNDELTQYILKRTEIKAIKKGVAVVVPKKVVGKKDFMPPKVVKKKQFNYVNQNKNLIGVNIPIGKSYRIFYSRKVATHWTADINYRRIALGAPGLLSSVIDDPTFYYISALYNLSFGHFNTRGDVFSLSSRYYPLSKAYHGLYIQPGISYSKLTSYYSLNPRYAFADKDESYSLTARKIGPTLGAGCTVRLKNFIIDLNTTYSTTSSFVYPENVVVRYNRRTHLTAAIMFGFNF